MQSPQAFFRNCAVFLYFENAKSQCPNLANLAYQDGELSDLGVFRSKRYVLR